MIQLIRTDGNHPDFAKLVGYLDVYLAEVDGVEHAFYDQYNGIDDIEQAIVAYEAGKAVGCGAMKAFEDGLMEIKRMYTLPVARGKGIASKVLQGLEDWARESGAPGCILETGRRQKEAVILYQKRGYEVIENFGQYMGIANSICFRKLF